MSELSSKKSGEASLEKVTRLKLTDREKKILLRAVQRYKQKVPSYIQSNQEEIEILDSFIKKLS